MLRLTQFLLNGSKILPVYTIYIGNDPGNPWVFISDHYPYPSQGSQAFMDKGHGSEGELFCTIYSIKYIFGLFLPIFFFFTTVIFIIISFICISYS